MICPVSFLCLEYRLEIKKKKGFPGIPGRTTTCNVSKPPDEANAVGKKALMVHHVGPKLLYVCYELR